MLFKETSNLKMAEIRRYIPVSVATSFPNLAPFIQAAEVSYIIPLLGDALYNQILSYYTTPGVLPVGITSQNKATFDILIEHIQRSLINLTYYAGYDFMNTSMNDSGFHRQETDTEKGLYKYQEEAIKSGFRSNGFNSLDTMLEYIEKHMDVFILFKTSANYTLRKSSIIPDTKTFDKIFDINNSRLVYLKLCRFIKEVEDFDIGALLGSDLYALLKAEILKDSPDPKILTLIPYVRSPLAYLAVSRASFQLGMIVTDKGLFFESTDSTISNSTIQKQLTDQQYHHLASRSKNTGEAYLEILRGFLLANRADYPSYTPVGGSPLIRDNFGKTSTWV